MSTRVINKQPIIYIHVKVSKINNITNKASKKENKYFQLQSKMNNMKILNKKYIRACSIWINERK